MARTNLNKCANLCQIQYSAIRSYQPLIPFHALQTLIQSLTVGFEPTTCGLEDHCYSCVNDGYSGNTESAGDDLTEFSTAHPNLQAVIKACLERSPEMHATVLAVMGVRA